VVWATRKHEGNFELGLEFMSDVNLWGIDFDPPGEVRRQARSDAEAD
jgi:hypothetical protein